LQRSRRGRHARRATIGDHGSQQRGRELGVSRHEQQSRRVLVVDDDDEVRRTLSQILQHREYDVRLAAGAAEARAILRSASFDVVLCAVMMPGETGMTFLQSIGIDEPRIPIVMMSRVSDPAVANTALERGAYGYITKPFDANQVVIALDSAIARAKLETENHDYREKLEWMVFERTIELADALEELAARDGLLRMSSEATIEMLAQAIEGRDMETGQLIARMSRYAALLADGCGLDDDHCRLIRLASPMHDITDIRAQYADQS